MTWHTTMNKQHLLHYKIPVLSAPALDRGVSCNRVLGQAIIQLIQSQIPHVSLGLIGHFSSCKRLLCQGFCTFNHCSCQIWIKLGKVQVTLPDMNEVRKKVCFPNILAVVILIIRWSNYCKWDYCFGLNIVHVFKQAWFQVRLSFSGTLWKL